MGAALLLLCLCSACSEQRSDQREPVGGPAAREEGVAEQRAEQPNVSEVSEPIALQATAPVGFLGESDAQRLGVLREGRIERLRGGRGGRSVGVVLFFEDGSRGYFKPEQSISGARWDAEVVAYELDRSLRIGRVPPTVARRIHWERLQHAIPERRWAEVIRDDADWVRGSLSWWIPEPLERWELGRDWERWLRQSGEAVFPSPYRPAREWREVINGRLVDERSELFNLGAQVESPGQLGALSDLVVFDYLIANLDRWSPDRTNVRCRGAGGPLIFLDNAASFWERTPELMERRLVPIEKFRRETVAALRSFDATAFWERMDRLPIPLRQGERSFIGEQQRRSFGQRLERLREHLGSLEGRFGDGIFLPAE